MVPGDFSYLQQYAQYVNREEFWKEALAQLNKDLAQADAVNIAGEHLKGENAAEAIVSALQAYLPKVTPRLSEILYRIDLGEQYEASLTNLPPDLYYRCLAEMVLKRIVQKVITRKAFSNKKIK